MSENRIKGYVQSLENLRLQELMAAGYAAGVLHTMRKHGVFTDPKEAGLSCQVFLCEAGVKILEVYHNGGDILDAHNIYIDEHRDSGL